MEGLNGPDQIRQREYPTQLCNLKTGCTKGGSIIVPLTSCLTCLDQSVLQIKTKIVSCRKADSKPVKQEDSGTVILTPLVFPGEYLDTLCVFKLDELATRGHQINLLIIILHFQLRSNYNEHSRQANFILQPQHKIRKRVHSFLTTQTAIYAT